MITGPSKEVVSREKDWIYKSWREGIDKPYQKSGECDRLV